MNKLLNKTKKGFTLVELLVVIAILAVLASVSVVGYLGFTTKARNSNAMTELAQVKEVLRGNLIDGKNTLYYFESDTLFVKNTTEVTSADAAAGKLATDLTTGSTSSTQFDELKDLNGTFRFNVASSAVATEGSTKGYWKIEVITYTRNAGGSAYWVAGEAAVAGDYSSTTTYPKAS